MSVNGITGVGTSYSTYEPAAKAVTENKEAAVDTASKGVVYEPSKEKAVDPIKQNYKPNTELINKLKADAEARTAQMRSLVEKLILGQGKTIGTADDIWSFLREGNFTVDAQTKAQAQADIAEDGYWGVEQTSQRIVDFAKALTGGDPSKIEEMREAFQKGFDQATKTWGDKLPEISQQTYGATMAKFDQWLNETQNVAAVEV